MLDDNPYLRKEILEKREYQIAIAKKCTEKNTLVVLHTSLGKTVIAIMVIADFLKKTGANPQKKALFLAPTKPLAEQHYVEGIMKFINLEKEKIALFTGEVKWEKRKEIWERSVIVVSTPQVIVNDLIAGRIKIENVGLVIFDEAHRGVGNYDYVHIGKLCRDNGIRTMGLTASPGHKKEKIMELCNNLNINWAEIRTERDPDVFPYIHDIRKEWIYTPLPPEIEKIAKVVREGIQDYVDEMNKFGFGLTVNTLTNTRFEEIEKQINAMLTTKKDSSLYTARSIMAALRKFYHALFLIETQGVVQFLDYYENKLLPDAREQNASRASKSVAKHPKMLEAVLRAKECKEEFPKITKIKEIVGKQLCEKPNSSILIFAEVRSTVTLIAEKLRDVSGAKVSIFVGQATKKGSKGMRLKQQSEIIKRFRAGEFNILCATSVAEEGLDIPSVDLVIFYEPVPSEKRLIQRRGRTGRRYAGNMCVLIVPGSADVAKYFASSKKEEKMKKIVKKIQEEFLKEEKKAEITRKDQILMNTERKNEIVAEDGEEKEQNVVREEKKKQPTLVDFFGASLSTAEHLEIIVDRREYRSEVHRELARLGVDVIFKVLPVGDYQIENAVLVERKSVEDFVNSIIDGRMFQQAKDLCNACACPIVIVEGKWNEYTRHISKSAIYGAVCSLAVDFGISVINFENSMEVAHFLFQTVRRISDAGRIPKIRFDRKPKTLAELQEYLVAG
ncbi:MAG: ERCC4 domain-containing protein, partial [Thermoplasmata archaeon]